MNRHPDRIVDYLQQIVESIAQARKYVANHTLSSFEQDQLVQDAVIRRLEIIGEAARRIDKADPEFIRTYPALQLDKAYGMRNRLSHAYDVVNVTLVWDVVQQHLPSMEQAIQQHLLNHS